MIDAITQYMEAETQDDAVEAMQTMIESGIVWHLEGSVGRAAMDMLRAGLVCLGERGCRGAYGQYIPSRTEVKQGTLGSVEYCEAHHWGCE